MHPDTGYRSGIFLLRSRTFGNGMRDGPVQPPKEPITAEGGDQGISWGCSGHAGAFQSFRGVAPAKYRPAKNRSIAMMMKTVP